MLYLVPTPIGNIKDITLRSLEILKEVDIILCEDTRVSRKLLSHYDVDQKLYSFHAHNEHASVSRWINELKSGKSIAMISDAGTPGISDPGFLLVRDCHENDISVTCLPGPTAFVPALVASGIPCDKFYFEGFLPQKKGRQTRWKILTEIKTTIVLYESPHRIVKCLQQIADHFGEEIQVCVSRELTKMYEEHSKGPIMTVLKDYQSRTSIKGEFVIVIDNNR